MNRDQEAFLRRVARHIVQLLESLHEGERRAEATLGRRVVDGRVTRLYLVIEFVDSGINPMKTYGMQPHPSHPETVDSVVSGRKPSRRSRRRRSRAVFKRDD